jgi:hypothetical protein
MDVGGNDRKRDKKRRSSLLFKAKKYLASKTAATAAGRMAITTFLGPAGSGLMQSLEEVAAKDCGAKRSKELVGIIVKFSCKMKVVEDERLVSKADYVKFEVSLLTLLTLLTQNPTNRTYLTDPTDPINPLYPSNFTYTTRSPCVPWLSCYTRAYC